jgi:uncharacterized membrane protein YcjF (UPF0283 family)
MVVARLSYRAVCFVLYLAELYAAETGYLTYIELARVWKEAVVA